MSEVKASIQKLKQFAYWYCDKSDEPEDGYWQYFDTLAEAVAECPDEDAMIQGCKRCGSADIHIGQNQSSKCMSCGLIEGPMTTCCPQCGKSTKLCHWPCPGDTAPPGEKVK